ncbi:MAG: alanyl-tRNA editing protein [Sphaerochaetaceae bacterium]|nr:alanyl-tRNA editing protein [Sphaerochaetaceae bacterium]
MNRLYYERPYLTSCECKVISLKKTDKNIEVKTDPCIFYPEGGGQSGDTGLLGPYQVTGTVKDEKDEPVLLLDLSSDTVKKGMVLIQKIDWEHRYKYMKMHTAQHLLSGLLFNMFRIGTTAVHLGEKYLTIETDQSAVSDETIQELVKAANRAIWESHSVNIREMSHRDAEALGLRRSIKVDGDVRLVEIEGVDLIACGGVHVQKTSEIGLVTYLSRELIRGHVRLYFKCAEAAFDKAVSSELEMAKICALLSCSEAEAARKVAKMQLDLTRATARISLFEVGQAEEEIKENLKDGAAVFESSLSVSRFQGLVKKFPDIALCVVNTGEGSTNWLIGLTGRFEELSASLREKLLTPCGAKGGGRLPLFQGVIETEKKKDFLDSFKEFLK